MVRGKALKSTKGLAKGKVLGVFFIPWRKYQYALA